jgi:hypothetical protein
MGCKNLWSREVIDIACTKVFRDTKLKSHRETILFERQKCLLPATQDAVSRVIQSRKIDAEIARTRDQIMALNMHMHNLANTQRRVAHGQVPANTEDIEKKQFVRKCPVDNCRGFLSTRWKCQICENNICKDCNEIRHDDTHTCDPNNVETVNLLKKDTKPCPKCGTMIFKISGCSQMWCPDCHTAFDWNTMKIETNRIHNPHYYEFMRGKGSKAREAGDIPCGGVPDITDLCILFKIPLRNHRQHYLPALTDPQHNEVFAIHRLVLHIDRFELPMMTRQRDPEERNQQLRVRYLLNELSEEEMKTILQKEEKAREKMRDQSNLLRMFCDVMGDMLRQLVVRAIGLDEFLNNADQLRNYFRESCRTIHNRYKCRTDWITDRWDLDKESHKPVPKQEVVVV